MITPARQALEATACWRAPGWFASGCYGKSHIFGDKKGKKKEFAPAGAGASRRKLRGKGSLLLLAPPRLGNLISARSQRARYRKLYSPHMTERSAAWRGGPDGHSCCDAPVIVSKRRRPSIVAMCTSWIVKPETRAMGAQWMMGGECVER